MSDYWGEKSRMGEYEKEQRINLYKGFEKDVMDELNKTERKLRTFRYECLDNNGEEIAQTIQTKYGVVRCLDLYTQTLDHWEELVLRTEVKNHQSLWKSKYVRMETKKFDDYLKVQSSEEIEGRVVFIVDGQGSWYWERLYRLDILKEREWIKSYVSDWFYIWDIKDLKVFKSVDEFFDNIY